MGWLKPFILYNHPDQLFKILHMKNPQSSYVKVIIISLFILTLSTLPNLSLAFFSDVPAEHPQYEAIKTLADENIIQGYGDGTFKPDSYINKIEFLKLAFSDLGYKPSNKPVKSDFKDVPANSWFAPYVQKALELGVIRYSKSNQKLLPKSRLTKIEAIKMAFGIEGIPTPFYTNIKQEDLFDDVKNDAWYSYLAKAAKDNGIISSKNPNQFYPEKIITRAEAAEIIYQSRLTRTIEDKGASLTITMQPSPIEGIDEVTSDLLNNPKFSILLDVWKKANTDFYYKNELQKDDLIYGAITGLVDKLGDKFTTFQEPLKAKELTNFLQGEFEGIGTSLDVVDNKIVILNPFTDSPAEKAGLKSGDEIIKINNQAIDKLTLESVLNLIKGPKGTSVHLTINRNGQTYDFDIIRAKINLTSVSSKIVNTNIAYIKIQQFLNSTHQEFTNAVNTLSSSNPKGFIIDLRGNPGGYLDSAIEISGHFIAEGKPVTFTKTAQNELQKYNSTQKGELAKYPTVVLIDESTASAAEIFAGALQDYKLAKLIGTKSYGKGSVQEIYNYADTSTLKISIAHWLTPLQRDVHGFGLIPDILVENTKENLTQNIDVQLNRAISELANR